MPHTNPAVLRAKLALVQEADDAYHNGSPIMDDATYDAHRDSLVAMVAAADPKDPVTVEAVGYLTLVGASVGNSKWVKVVHKAPMTSLNKVQVEAELDEWASDLGPGGAGASYVLSDKCDGISISLIYVNDRLVQALTRGDGEVGEDITRNVVRMKGVVHVIKGFTGQLRGEIVLRRSDWKTHFPTYSNPRNAAAGIAKREDGVGVEHLTVLHYQMIRESGKAIPSKVVEFQALAALGCAVPNWYGPYTLGDVKAQYAEYVAGKRAALDYDIDGLVVELNDLIAMDNLGLLNKRPKGAVAYKFPHEKKPTTLRNVRWQVGKSGRVTPVAEFDEIELAGVRVKQASLHNVARVRLLKLFVGCSILVSRRNDVIPMVEANLDDNIHIS